MCEIAVLPAGDANDENVQAILDTARDLYDSNPHGLGLVAVKREGGVFNYRVLKTGWTTGGIKTTTVRSWLYEHLGESWRLILHARFKTAGAIDVDGTHPISVRACPEESWRYVLHNGVVRNHKVKRRKHDGHIYNTEVDSEAIAHSIPKPGDDFGTEDSEWDTPRLTGNLNYLLLSHDGILVYSDGKYDVTSDFQMTCQRDPGFIDSEDDDPEDSGYFYATPDGELLHEEEEDTSKYTVGTSRSRGGTYGGYGTSKGSSTFSSASGSDDSETTTADADHVHGTAGERTTDDVKRVLSGGSFEETRGADFYDNPAPEDPESLPLDTHEGIFAAADALICLEHGEKFRFSCAECNDMDIDLSLIPVFVEPHIVGSTQTHGTMIDAEGEYYDLKRCPHEEGIWYTADVCPLCETSHHEEREGMRAGWGYGRSY